MRLAVKEKAVTLLELLIAAGLLALLLLQVYQLFLVCLRHQQTVQTSLDLHRSGLTGLSRLASEMTESHRDSVRFDPSPTTGIVFASARDRLGPDRKCHSGRLHHHHLQL